MSKKNKEKKNTNHPLKNWVITIIVILVILGTYKCILVSIANRGSDADTYISERTVNDYASDIVITNTEITDKITFEDMYINNSFNELTAKAITDKYPTKTFEDNDGNVQVIIRKDIKFIDNFNFSGSEEYLETSNIKDDDDLYDFMISYKRTSMDMLDSFSDIRSEMFKRNLFLLIYSPFDEIHHVTGDLNGRVIIRDNKIIYELYNKDDMYTITFVDYDLDSTISIVSTISFKEV